MLKSLIENQKIRIDAHQRGSGHIEDWDDPSSDIHIHKTTKTKIGGRSVDVDIRIPINSDREATFRIGKIESDAAKSKLSKEISAALSDTGARQAFVDDLINVLDNYPTILSSRKRCLEAVENLVRHFDLGKKAQDEIVIYVGEQIQSLTSVFQDKNNRLYSISLGKDDIEISEIDKYSRKQILLNRRNK